MHTLPLSILAALFGKLLGGVAGVWRGTLVTAAAQSLWWSVYWAHSFGSAVIMKSAMNRSQQWKDVRYLKDMLSLSPILRINHAKQIFSSSETVDAFSSEIAKSSPTNMMRTMMPRYVRSSYMGCFPSPRWMVINPFSWGFGFTIFFSRISMKCIEMWLP